MILHSSRSSGSGFSRYFGRRGSWAAQSIAAVSMRHCRPPAESPGLRLGRFLQARKQRRRRGIVWALIAIFVLATSLDWVSRIDEVAYNETTPDQ